MIIFGCTYSSTTRDFENWLQMHSVIVGVGRGHRPLGVVITFPVTTSFCTCTLHNRSSDNIVTNHMLQVNYLPFRACIIDVVSLVKLRSCLVQIGVHTRPFELTLNDIDRVLEIEPLSVFDRVHID